MDLLTVKIVAVASLGIASLICGLIPISMRKYLFKGGQQSGSKRQKFFSFSLCFGAGVLFAAVMVHIMPEIREGFERARMLEKSLKLHDHDSHVVTDLSHSGRSYPPIGELLNSENTAHHHQHHHAPHGSSHDHIHAQDKYHDHAEKSTESGNSDKENIPHSVVKRSVEFRGERTISEKSIDPIEEDMVDMLIENGDVDPNKLTSLNTNEEFTTEVNIEDLIPQPEPSEYNADQADKESTKIQESDVGSTVEDASGNIINLENSESSSNHGNSAVSSITPEITNSEKRGPHEEISENIVDFKDHSAHSHHADHDHHTSHSDHNDHADHSIQLDNNDVERRERSSIPYVEEQFNNVQYSHQKGHEDHSNHTDHESETGHSDHEMHPYPLTELLICAGVFLVYFVEELIGGLVGGNGSHGHSHIPPVPSNNSNAQKNGNVNSDENSGYKKKFGPRGAWTPTHIDGVENPGFTEDSDTVSWNSTSKTDDNLRDQPRRYSSNPPSLTTESTEKPNFNQILISNLRSILMVLALSFHSTFEGLAVGLQENAADVWYLTLAVAAHKLVIHFSVSLELMTIGVSTFSVLLYTFIMALTNPIGASLGMFLTADISYFSDPNQLFIITALQALAGGTILYIVFFEIMERERAKEGGRMMKFFAFFIGFIFLAIVENFGQHSHGPVESGHDH